MRMGLALWPDRGLLELAELAAVAEDAGFDDLWWPDHYDAREISAVLAMCATRTARIRLGTAVTSPMLRHPALLASMFATLAELSGGRAVAGLGPGGFEVKTELLADPRSPLSATREAVAILRALVRGERYTDTDGLVFPVSGVGLGFTPGFDVPVYLAGRGPRMLELSGEIADGVITHGLAGSYLDLVAERVRVGLERAGRPPTGCDIALMFEVALAERATALDTLRPRCLLMVGGAYDEALIPTYGLNPEEVTRVRAAVRARDPAAPGLISDEMVDAFCLAGPSDWIGRGLSAMADAGMGTAILSPGRGVDAATIVELGNIVKEVAR